jgi:hypothetical protein
MEQAVGSSVVHKRVAVKGAGGEDWSRWFLSEAGVGEDDGRNCKGKESSARGGFSGNSQFKCRHLAEEAYWSEEQR